MREYIEKEHKDKKGSSIDLSDWTEVFLKVSDKSLLHIGAIADN